MFRHAYIQRLKPKLKFILTLAITLVATLLMYKPLETKATDINLQGVDSTNVIGGGSGKNTSQDYIDNAGYAKTGWLIYLADKSGSVVSDKIVYQNAERSSLPSGYRLTYLHARLGGKPVTHMAGGKAEWGTPFNENQNSRASEIYEYLEKPVSVQGISCSRAAWIVYYYLGKDALKLFVTKPDDHYLILESCAYHEVLTSTHSSKMTAFGEMQRQLHLATSYGWMELERDQGCDKFGNIDSDTYWYKGADVSWCDNRALQISCTLLEKWPGLPDVPTVFSEDYCGRISYTTALSVGGYGMLAVRGQRGEMIHTYWQDNGSPGDPEPNTGTGQQITNDDGSTSTGDKKGTCNIVKCYYTEERKGDEVTYTDDTNGYNTLECTNVVSIDNEPNDYKLEAWAISNTLNKNLKAVTGGSVTWHSNVPSPIEKGDSETVVTLDENQTVYVLLKRVIEDDPPEDIEENYVIHQSSITKRIKISEQDGKQLENNLKNQTISWYISAHATQCGGHQVTTEVDCDGSCVVQVLHDHNNTTECYDNTGDGKCDVVYVNSEPCGKKHESTKTVYCTGFNLTEKALKLGLKETNHSGTSTVLAKIWQKVFRGGNDNVTYAAIDRTSMGAVEYGTSGWDYKCVIYRGKDKLTLAKWKNTATGKTNSKLTSDLGFKSENTSKGTRKQNDYIDKFSLSFTGNSPDKETTATASTKGDGYTGDLCTDTKKLTFLGSNGSKPIAINDIGVKVEVYSGKSEVSKDTTTMGENNVPSGEEISFYPYIQMQYDTLTADDKKIYVLGEYKRSFSPTDYFKLSISGGDANGLNVNSYQWSTHAEAQKLLMRDSNCLGVLPGGAMISLTTPESAIRMVTVETQQVILKDKGLTQVQKTNGSGTNLTEEQAKANHASLVASTVQALENVYVTQFASNGGETIKVDPGTDLNKLSLSGKASTDNKYYFRADGTSNGIGEGDLDVDNNKDTNTTEVTYYTEPTSSEVKVNGSASWDKTNTKAKLKAALELGTGNDSEAGWGTKWYNEAFDGVTVIRQVTTLKVGLLRPTERTSILDPKLTPESSGKNDLFTKSITSYYKTTGSNRMGSFKGKQATLPVGSLYKSKSFLIPNVTTQDLN